MRIANLLISILIILCLTKSQAEDVAESKYTPPSSNGFFTETFNDMKLFQSRWYILNNDIFKGEWEVSTGLLPANIEGDEGLILKSAAQRHAIVSQFEKIFDVNNKDFVVQYEVRFNNPLQCGGAYIKLLTSMPNWTMDDFNDKSPYTIMFGPDRCGDTNKVHFIFRYKNPITNEYEEKHMTKKVEVPKDTNTHLYTLAVKADNTFEVYVDQVSMIKGNLLTSLTPPINPPAQIDDPSDSKPSTWVDLEKISDPTASKPEDWNEDAPKTIEDVNAIKPVGWEDDEKETIPDPKVVRPADWDDESDGEWEAPTIENPKCQIGCGEWKRPMKANPEYKGKWVAPLIPNPDYIGEWKARKIPNPNFYEDLKPSFSPMAAVGIEVWTMQNEIEFDNFFIDYSLEAAKDFASKTFTVKKELEAEYDKLNAPKSADSEVGFAEKTLKFLEENALVSSLFFGILLVIVMGILLYYCSSSEAPVRPPRREFPIVSREGVTESKEESVDKDSDAEEVYESAKVEEIDSNEDIPFAGTNVNDEAAPKKRTVGRTKTPKE